MKHAFLNSIGITNTKDAQALGRMSPEELEQYAQDKVVALLGDEDLDEDDEDAEDEKEEDEEIAEPEQGTRV